MIPKAQGACTIPAAIGVGLRAPHISEIIAARPAIGWLEVHAENYLGGGPAPVRFDTIRQEYPLSLHGVGLSLGSAEGLADEHLWRLRALIVRTEPFLVSEHLSWSITGDAYLNDLLPLPYTEESLDIVVANVAKAQAALGRRLLVENPASYVAGHSRVLRGGQGLLIDDHGSPVAPAVWDLYRRALKRFGLVPSLVEWDNNLPPLTQLIDEARKAERAALATVDSDARAA
jgi:uncharacterized protein (UPF0276 family)